MRLHEAIKSNKWPSVEITLRKLYPGRAELIHEYERVFEHLQCMKVDNLRMHIAITELKYEPEDWDTDSIVNILGLYESLEEPGQIKSFDLASTEWKYCLGLELTPETMRDYTELEIIAHCLYDMTYIAFDEEVIQEENRLMELVREEIKATMTAENKDRPITLEELVTRIEEMRSRSLS